MVVDGAVQGGGRILVFRGVQAAAAVCCCCRWMLVVAVFLLSSCWISQHHHPAAPPCFPIRHSDCGRVHCRAPHPQGVQGLGAGCPEGARRAPGRQQGLGSQALWPRPAGRCRTGGGHSRGWSGGRGGGGSRCAGAHAWCCSRGRGGRGRRSGGGSGGWCGAHTGGCQARLWGSGHRAVLQEGEQPINAGQQATEVLALCTCSWLMLACCPHTT